MGRRRRSSSSLQWNEHQWNPLLYTHPHHHTSLRRGVWYRNMKLSHRRTRPHGQTHLHTDTHAPLYLSSEISSKSLSMTAVPDQYGAGCCTRAIVYWTITTTTLYMYQSNGWGCLSLVLRPRGRRKTRPGNEAMALYTCRNHLHSD